LDDGRVAIDELHEIVYDICEENGEKYCSTYQRLFCGDGVVLRDGNERKDIHLLQDFDAEV
jgi:hypothetical protein